MANDGSGSGRNPDSRFHEETVDEILSGILNKDGSFNEEFDALLTKYLGEDAAHVTSLRGVDLSSRMDEPRPRQRVEYEDPNDRYSYGPGRDVDRRIEEKMPEDVRYMYAEAASQAQRPEFTASGGVRYPSMGVGDSEERVVYDAEWEERARQEAARLQRVREDRMLRGDSTYVRSFVSGGRPMRGRSPFIDPLSPDDDFDEPYRPDRRRQNDGDSFFQEGPPARQTRNKAGRQRSTGAVSGRTGSARTARSGNPGREDVFESFSDSYESAERSRAAWMQPDDGSSSGRTRRGDRRRDQLPRITSTLRDDYDRMSGMMEGGRPERRERPPEYPEYPEQPELDPRGERFAAAFRHNRGEEPAAEEEPQPARVDPRELEHVREERQGLRSTVSEIVDKYDRRSEEEAAARERAQREELERQEAERLARESFLKNLSSEVASVLYEEDDFDGSPEEYDDLTGVTGEGFVPETDALKAFAASHGGSGEAPEKEAQKETPEEAQEETADETPEETADGTGGPDLQTDPDGSDGPEEMIWPAELESASAPDDPAAPESANGPETAAEADGQAAPEEPIPSEEPTEPVEPEAAGEPDYGIYLDHYTEPEPPGAAPENGPAKKKKKRRRKAKKGAGAGDPGNQ